MQQERVQSSLRRPSSQQVLPSLPSRSFLPREQLKFRPQQQQFFPTATSRLMPPFPAPTPSRILDNRQHRNPPGQAPPSHSILAALNQASGADFFRVAQRFGLRHFAARNRHLKQLWIGLLDNWNLNGIASSIIRNQKCTHFNYFISFFAQNYVWINVSQNVEKTKSDKMLQKFDGSWCMDFFVLVFPSVMQFSPLLFPFPLPFIPFHDIHLFTFFNANACCNFR